MTAKKPEPFDLAAIDTTSMCDKPYRLQIKHPVNFTEIGVYIDVLGKDSTAYRNRIRALSDESTRKGALRQEKLEALEAKSVELLMTAVVGWGSDALGDGKVQLGGEALDFAPKNVRKVLTDILPIRDQVTEAINSIDNFFPS